MHMHVRIRVRDHDGLHLVAGHACLRLDVKDVGALDRLDVAFGIANACTHRFVSGIDRLSQFERPVLRLAFFNRVDAYREAVLGALGTSGKGAGLDRITRHQRLGGGKGTHTLPTIRVGLVLGLCRDIHVNNVIERGAGVIDGPGAQDDVVAAAVAGNGARVFLLERAIAASRPVNGHRAAAFNGTEGCQLKSVTGQWQVRVPARFGNEVFPLGRFVSGGEKPAERRVAVVDFGQMPTVRGLGIHGCKQGVFATGDLAVSRAQCREAFGCFTDGLRFIFSRAAVGIQFLLTGISARRRAVHVAMGRNLLRCKHRGHQR